MWGLPDSAIYGTYKRVSHGRGGKRRKSQSPTWVYLLTAKVITEAIQTTKKSKVK